MGLHSEVNYVEDVSKPMDSEKVSRLRSQSIHQISDGDIEDMHNRNGQFHRSFTPRQIHVRPAGEPDQRQLY